MEEAGCRNSVGISAVSRVYPPSQGPNEDRDSEDLCGAIRRLRISPKHAISNVRKPQRDSEALGSIDPEQTEVLSA